MADERRPAAPRSRTPDPRTPPPRPREDRPGPSWRVDPAPDGRGAPPGKRPMLPFSFRRFITILALLLLANYLLAAIFAGQEDRKRIPYTPTFIDQVEKGNVKEISARGDTVQGEYKKKVKDAKKFETEVPAFADDQQLSRLLQDQKVTVNAKPPEERSLLATLLISFGPVLLLVGAVRVPRAPREPASRGRGARAVRPLARRAGPRAARTRGSTSTTSPASTRPRRSSPRSSTSSSRPRSTSGSAPASRAGCCCRARPERARRCWRRPSRARRACRSSRSRPRSSSRRSWAWAPRECATSSSRPRTPPRRSSSSTSWTRSAAPAPAAAASPAAGTTSASRPSTRSSPRWTASRPATAWWCSAPPTAPRSSTRPCCARAASTAAWPSSRPTSTAARRSSRCTPARCRLPMTWT